MPNSWTGIRHWQLTTNNYGLDQNCYYCTVAALLNTDVDTLIRVTETMQQDTATSDEVATLFADANCPVVYRAFANEGAAAAFVSNFPDRSAVAIGYTRGNGTGHMVVAMRWSSAPYGVRFIDYQQSPPGVYDSLAHEGAIMAYTVFYKP